MAGWSDHFCNENDLLLSKLLKEEHFTLFVNSIIEMELLQGVLKMCTLQGAHSQKKGHFAFINFSARF